MASDASREDKEEGKQDGREETMGHRGGGEARESGHIRIDGNARFYSTKTR